MIYYVQIERQGCLMSTIKVEANDEEEAINKALRAIHHNDDIYVMGSDAREEILNQLEDGDYLIDENGDELDIDAEFEEDEKEDVLYIVHSEDFSGFECDHEYDNQEEAIANAMRIWDEGEGGFSKVSVHCVNKDNKELRQENGIWFSK